MSKTLGVQWEWILEGRAAVVYYWFRIYEDSIKHMRTQAKSQRCGCYAGLKFQFTNPDQQRQETEDGCDIGARIIR